MRSTSIVLFCSGFLAISSPIFAQDGDLRERFLKEAPPAWNEYIARACHVQGQGSSQKVDLRTGKTILEEGPITFKINGLLALFTSPSKDNRKRLICKNEDYEFVIEDGSAREWSLIQLLNNTKQLETSMTRPGTERLGSSPWQQVMSFTCKGLSINATWLPAMKVAPSFKITGVSASNQNAKDIRVDFQYEPSKQHGNPVRGGYVVLDPSRYWQIKTAEVDGYEPKPEVQFKMQIENEFDDSALEYPYVTKQLLRTFHPSIIDYSDTYLITLQKLPPTEVAPFRLPAYGIPEPEFPSNRSWAVLIFWNLVVIFCLLAAIVFRRLSHRAAAEPAAKES